MEATPSSRHAPVLRTKARPFPASRFPRGAGGLAIAVDPTLPGGRLVVAWTDDRNGDTDVFVTTSDDQRRNWSPRVRVNDDAVANGKDQTMQALTVDPADGASYLLFYDGRDDAGNLLATVTLARSSNRGRTFINYAWSAAQSDPTKASLGDYVRLAALGGRVYRAWPETVPSERAAGPKARRSAPGERADDELWPSGPTALRIGIADFRTVKD